jgi:NADPH-ferrihemoprotein reductase
LFLVHKRFVSSFLETNRRSALVSSKGTAEAFANDLEFDAQDLKIDTELIDAADFSIKALEGSERSFTAFVLACYGEGEPTDNAKRFHAELFSPEMNGATRLSSASFAVFGLGNSQCFRDRFNVIGKGVDKRLEELGGHRLLPCGVGDASQNINAEFTLWKNELLRLAQEGQSSSSPPPVDTQYPDTAASVATAQPPLDHSEGASPPSSTSAAVALSVRQLALAPADRPIFMAQVKQSEQLFSVVDEFSSATHLTFDLRQSRPLIPIGCSGLTPEVMTSRLQAGDHIGIFAPNSRQVVERFAVAAGLSLESLDSPFESTSWTLRQVLTWQLNLTGIAPVTSLKVLHRWASDPAAALPCTARHLQSLVSDYDSGFRSRGLDLAAVLEMIPKRRSAALSSPLPLAALLKTLPPLAPRLYSFTHNPVTHRDTASLLCRLLRYRPSAPYVAVPSSRIVDGVCSSYLNEGVSPGDEVALFFRESMFHLPPSRAQPVIMIAGGTGIAPFLSFLEERVRLYRSGEGVPLAPAVLYYGCRNAEEYMFREELLRFLREGEGQVLAKAVVSFSSPNAATATTDSRLPGREVILAGAKNIPTVALEDAASLCPLLDQGAHVYVCGGAGNFGKAVRFTVDELVKASRAGGSLEADQGGVRLLVDQKRYFEDLAD